MKYYIIAGEASGDLHGSNLMKGLMAEDLRADIRFWGGNMMEAVGGTKVHDYRDGAVMGLTDVLKNAGRLLGNLSACKKDILEWHPDVVILIDYPGFNMKIARFAHTHGIKVFYYIAPKTWASREGRNRKLRRYVDKLFIVFPFEIKYFTKQHIPFVYKGNPLIDAVDGFKAEPASDTIAMLAGSRKGEISRMMPILMQVADTLHNTPGYTSTRFVIAGAPSRSLDDYSSYIAGRDYVSIEFGNTYGVLSRSRAAVINSGTASLEAALLSTPQVVCWSTSKLTAFVARNILGVMKKIRFISLGNLIIDKMAFRELIQEDFTSANVVAELRRICEDEQYRQLMLQDYRIIRDALGGSGASRSVARAMMDEL